MPFIQDADLLAMHKDLEKSKNIHQGLLKQVKVKNKELKRYERQKNIFALLAVIFFIGMVVSAFFVLGIYSTHKSTLTTLVNDVATGDKVLMTSDSLGFLKGELNCLKLENKRQGEIKKFYLAKQILDKKIIFSVQVKTFVENKINLSSGLLNSLFVKSNAYWGYSLGVFETLEEAQIFRNELAMMGFEDAFIASYRDGQRLKIENPY